MEKHLNEVRHDYIRYANCWEDADILLQGLQIAEDDQVLSIGSGGDNSFSMLAHQPKIVVAVDINPVQLQVIKLKKAAFQALDHNEFIAFLGFIDAADRNRLYNKVKPFLDPASTSFWEERTPLINKGIIHQGKFEHYFQLFHQKVLPFIHSKNRIDRLFQPKTAEAQKIFFDQKWNNRRWNWLFKLFFSKTVMGKLGRDPQFMKEVKIDVAQFIIGQAAKAISAKEAQENYFLKYTLTGSFGEHLPHYARAENFPLIKNNIDRLIIRQGLIEDVFEEYPRFNRFNLSNIFEYMDQQAFSFLSNMLINHAEPNSRFAYWNLMVSRRMSEISDSLVFENALSQKLTQQDKGFFYQRFLIDQKD